MDNIISLDTGLPYRPIDQCGFVTFDECTSKDCDRPCSARSFEPALAILDRRIKAQRMLWNALFVALAIALFVGAGAYGMAKDDHQFKSDRRI